MVSISKRIKSLTLGLAFCGLLQAQTSQDSLFIRKIYDEALLRGHAYARLGQLCKDIGPRLSGSDNAEKGIEWSVNMLNTYGFDSVYKQPVMVPRWERGAREPLLIESALLSQMLGSMTDFNIEEAQTDINKSVYPTSPHPLIECKGYLQWLLSNSEGINRGDKSNKNRQFPMEISALGGSIEGKAQGKIVVIRDRSQLDSLGKLGRLKDRIVLLNRPFEEDFIKTFKAYGSCVSQRVYGAVWCAPYGAKAVLIRSLSNTCDMHPHTGVTYYEDSIVKIPIAAVSTASADALAYLAQKDSNLEVSFLLNCRTLPERLSANVCAELKGTQSPKNVIAFGGHFDSWDEGEGAHDDGAGIMHCFEALRILKTLGYQPRNTLRMVFWINEENGTRGALEYARATAENGDRHIAALESDRGGFTPRGFGLDSALMRVFEPYKELFIEYGITDWEKGGGGVDIGPLKKADPSLPLASLAPDSQRYFDMHHAASDVFENVNKRELHLGAAAVAAWIYITDSHLNR
jgi:carboxypeptidase Q